METLVNNISIEKSSTSKIGSVDFDNLPFGSIYTDHMLVCEYVDGAWERPTIKPYADLSLDPASKIFHYGQSIFERG